VGFLASALAPSGAVLPFAGTTAPNGWLICDGAPVSRSVYANLFSVLGTSYGSGDGSTTFNIPDYRWTFMRGRGPNISVTGSGTAASNQATFTAHGFNRTGVKARLSSGTLTGLAASTDYWVIVVDANTLAFATTKSNAIGNTRISISGANSAVIVQWEDPDAGSRASNTAGANSAASVGSSQQDQMQGHRHQTASQSGASGGNLGTNTNGGGYMAIGIVNNTNGATTSGSPIEDGNATPRSGTETRPSNISINYIIKI